MTVISSDPIGIVHSCFKQKFGVPRQAGLVPEARANLEILPPYNQPEAFRELSEFSHIWLIFLFHQVPEGTWKPTIRPPRLGGNRRRGVFATRSPFRPNRFGLSAVELLDIHSDQDKLTLHLAGADLVDGTPVLDIKPYLPYADQPLAAEGGFAAQAPPAQLAVSYTSEAKAQLVTIASQAPHFPRLLEAVLAQDPRPAYQNDSERIYGIHLEHWNIRWRIENQSVEVLSCTPLL